MRGKCRGRNARKGVAKVEEAEAVGGHELCCKDVAGRRGLNVDEAQRVLGLGVAYVVAVAS